MITSYEVGTIFKIIDRSETTRRNMIADMTRLEQLSAKTKQSFLLLGNQRLGGLSRSIKALTDQSLKLTGSVDSALKTITAGTDIATKETRSLAAEWRNVAQAARQAGSASAAAARAQGAASAMGPWGPRSGFGGRGGGSGGYGGGSRRSLFNAHLSRRGELPGGTHYGLLGGGLAGNAVLAAAGLIGYGAYQEGELQSSIARMMLAAGQPLNAGMMKTSMAQQIRSAIQGGMVETGLSARDLEGSATKLTLQMGGIPFKQRVGLLPEIFRFAGIEANLKGVDAGDATQSLVGLLHMTGAYKPADISKLASKFAFASTISPVGLPGIERAASYVLPMGVNALGLDPGSLLLIMAQAQSAGILSGKSGTWFQGMLQSLSPKSGFASLLTGHGAKGRMAGLQQLGLADQSGAPTGLRMLEKNDWADFIGTVKQHLDAIPQEQRMGVVSQAMGSAQAARGLMTLMLPAMIQLLPELRREQKNFAQDPISTLNAIADASPVMQFQRTWQELNVTLMDIGSIVLPLVLSGLREFNSLLRDIDGPIKWALDHMPHASASSQTHGSNRQGGGLIFGTVRGLGTIGKWLNGPNGSNGAAVTGGPGAVKTITVPGSSITGSLSSPTSPAAGMFHKTSFLVNPSALQQSQTWSDIGQGSPYSVPFPTTTGNGPTVGGMPVVKMAYSPSGGAGIPFGGAGIPLAIGGGGRGAIGIPRLAAPSGSIAHIKQSQAAGARRMMTDLMARGWSKEAAAVAAGNASVESGFNPSNSSGDGGTSWGLMQWHLDRRRAMVQWGQQHGKAWNDWGSQIGFLDQEWRKRFGNDSIKSHDLNALKYMGKRYEGYSTDSFAQRNGLADKFLKLNSDVGSVPSPVVPRGHDKPIIIQHQSMLDGRVVAQSTMRHIVRQGNGPARGPRTADYTAVRPINV